MGKDHNRSIPEPKWARKRERKRESERDQQPRHAYRLARCRRARTVQRARNCHETSLAKGATSRAPPRKVNSKRLHLRRDSFLTSCAHAGAGTLQQGTRAQAEERARAGCADVQLRTACCATLHHAPPTCCRRGKRNHSTSHAASPLGGHFFTRSVDDQSSIAWRRKLAKATRP